MSALSSPSLAGSRWVLPFLGAVTFLTAIGNLGLVSVMPAIGRMLHIPDFLVAGIFSVSALTWAISSPFWVSRIERAGSAFYIRAGLVGFLLSMGGCALSVELGGGTTAELALWGKNLTDKEYKVSAINLGVLTLGQYGDPRSFGGELRIRF